MPDKREKKGSSCCGPKGAGGGGMAGGFGCCRIEAIVSVDERGQLVLPKDVRERAGIGAGDKLALLFHGGRHGHCCLTLMKAESLADGVRTMLGPMMKEVLDFDKKEE